MLTRVFQKHEIKRIKHVSKHFLYFLFHAGLWGTDVDLQGSLRQRLSILDMSPVQNQKTQLYGDSGCSLCKLQYLIDLRGAAVAE